MKDGAGGVETADLLEGFVEKVTGVEIGGDENVGLASNRGEIGIIRRSAGSPFGGLFGGDGRIESGVELHFAVDEEVDGWLRFGEGLRI